MDKNSNKKISREYAPSLPCLIILKHKIEQKFDYVVLFENQKIVKEYDIKFENGPINENNTKFFDYLINRVKENIRNKGFDKYPIIKIFIGDKNWDYGHLNLDVI